MILDTDPDTLKRWIEAAAHDQIPVPPGDASPWDAFYAEYRGAPRVLRARVDHTFEGLTSSPDTLVRGLVLSHWLEADPQVGYAALEAILQIHPDMYANQPSGASVYTLRARLLNGLATHASGPDTAALILSSVKGCGRLPGAIGTYFGGQGVDATDALVRVRPDVESVDAVKDAGYELHRDPARWSDALTRSAGWPEPLRTALLAGGAEHRARFGGA